MISLGSRDLLVAVDDSDLWAGATADKAGGMVTWSIYRESTVCSLFCFGGAPSKQGGVLLAY